MVELVTPALTYLPGYRDALTRGWSPDNIRGPLTAAEEMVAIERDPAGFVALKADNRAAQGGPIKLPDGSTAERLPGFVRWIWDGDFCGSMGLRFQPGTGALPAHVLGHIGYTVVPWKRDRGYATRALALLLAEARAEGLPYVEITTAPDNTVSQKVILANGGVFVEAFKMPAQYGFDRFDHRYRVMLRVDKRSAIHHRADEGGG